MTDRCDLTDLLPDQCGCRHHRAGTTITDEISAHRSQLLLQPGWVTAQWPGYCQRCLKTFHAGHAIRWFDPEGWRAECCS